MHTAIIIQDAAVKAALERAAAKLADMSPLMERIGVYYTRSVRENFDRQSSPDGTPWKRLSNATLHPVNTKYFLLCLMLPIKAKLTV